MMNYAREYARHAAMTVATTLLTGALFYVLRIVLYKNLSLDEYGLFYVLFSYITVVQTITSFGFDPGLVPFVTKFREEKDNDALKSLTLSALVPQGIFTAIVVVAFLVGPPLAAWLDADGDSSPLLRIFVHPASQGLLAILALHAVFVLLFKCGQQVLLGLQAMAWRNASDLARSVLCMAGAYVLLQLGWKVYAPAVAYTLGAAAEIAVVFVAMMVAFPQLLRAKFTWRPELVRDVFDSGKWLSVAFGGIAAFSSVDTIVISLVRSDLADAAAYQIALPTITILYSLMIAAGISLLPTVRTLWLRNERALLSEGLRKLYGAAIVVMVPGGVLLACGSDVLMTALFGNVGNADDAFNVFAAGGIAFFLAYINLHVLAAIDRARPAGIAVVCGLLLDIGLNIPLTYWLGIRGTAIAGICGYTLTAGMGLLAIRQSVRVSAPIRSVVGSVVTSAALGIAAWGLRETDLINVNKPIISAFCGGMLLLAGLGVLELLGLSELRSLFRGSASSPTARN